MSEEHKSVVYETFVQNGEIELCNWVFDDLEPAKETVEEFIELKYGLEIGSRIFGTG